MSVDSYEKLCTAVLASPNPSALCTSSERLHWHDSSQVHPNFNSSQHKIWQSYTVNYCLEQNLKKRVHD